ncbi:uncharacterized protein CLAFUR5_13827 [Fulvia fulva]|uniref:Uncharacterized protein n=1 Tax=Passalora fulva TaxID=5499 RepID=A0A9Q8PL47_PASFU|nr:uncharacterized protein CLAFUR5_13827 [Fulvia fulva]UJO24495.1 hypothetical protein CLAFUR5_13827 [Fulvia fulva]WPV37028.1 hypothetical protein CLAFUW7_13997 [Fulvia fulva]
MPNRLPTAAIDMLSLRATVLCLATLACGLAQTTTGLSHKAGKEAQLFIHNMDPNAQWAASIQNACHGSTTYVLSCTSAANDACSPQTATITEGTDFYMVTTPAIYSETSATYTESCTLDPEKSSALCTATIVAGQFGHDIAITISYNLTGTNYYQYDVQVTAGADHTANGGACLAHVKGAAHSPRLGGGLQDIAIVGAVLLAGLSILLAL